MRKLISSHQITLDGYVDHTAMIADEETHQIAVDELAGVDTVIFGRVTYQLFADAWPAMAEDPAVGGAVLAYARKINSMPKIVFSNTLKRAEWNNATLIKGDAAEQLSRLKQSSGGDLVIAASGKLVRSLMRRDLIDEYRLMFNPIIQGSGTRLFPDGIKMKLRLVDSKRFNSGVVALIYRPDGK
jgi:dihydrofolate reductase